MGKKAMDHDELVEAMQSCLELLYDQDFQILAQDIGERAVCGRLAMLMAATFPQHDVDIEYNRKGLGIEPKDIEMPDENGNLITSRVFPDIIVHERGNNLRNLLVVEVKKSTNTVPDEHDHAKLQALCWQLEYQNGLFLRLSTGPEANLRSVQYDWFIGPVINGL